MKDTQFYIKILNRYVPEEIPYRLATGGLRFLKRNDFYKALFSDSARETPITAKNKRD